jgi:hypothetical protein
LVGALAGQLAACAAVFPPRANPVRDPSLRELRAWCSIDSVKRSMKSASPSGRIIGQ